MLEPMFEWARVVYHGTACDLPGVAIPYDRFIPAMWRAVQEGFVSPLYAEMTAQWLRWGVDAGIPPGSLRGQRVFQNYESSVSEAARVRVADATAARVAGGRTLDLGRW